MARPTNKKELAEASKTNFDKLNQLIDSLTSEQQNAVFAFDDRDRNIRDVLVHLHEWHKLLLNWVKSNQKGNSVPFLPEPYNWKTYPQMNIEFWKKHQTTLLDNALNQLKNSHKDVMVLVENFSNEELFSKKHFNWTGTTSLGAYFVSSTASHYDWAIKKIKKHKKDC